MDAASILINATATSDDDCVSYCVPRFIVDRTRVQSILDIESLFPPFLAQIIHIPLSYFMLWNVRREILFSHNHYSLDPLTLFVWKLKLSRLIESSIAQ